MTEHWTELVRLYVNGSLALEDLARQVANEDMELFERVLPHNLVLRTPLPRFADFDDVSGCELLLGSFELAILDHLHLLSALPDALEPDGGLLLFEDVYQRIHHAPLTLASRESRAELGRMRALAEFLGRAARVSNDGMVISASPAMFDAPGDVVALADAVQYLHEQGLLGRSRVAELLRFHDWQPGKRDAAMRTRLAGDASASWVFDETALHALVRSGLVQEVLPMLTESERSGFLAVAQATRAAHSETPVHTLVEEQAARTPGAVAIRCDDAVVTYADLETASNRLAHHLQTTGVGSDTLVGVCLDRGVEMVVAILAVLKAGAAYVPLDPDFPTDRLQFMAADAELSVVITQTTLVDRLGSVVAQKLCLDQASDSRDSDATTPPPGKSNPGARAYVIYTSGSTGRPKGVEITHAGLTNVLQAMWQSPGVTSDDIVSAVTTLSFDIAITELLLPLTVGAQVALMSRRVAADGRKLADALKRYGVTVVQATPATFQLLIDSGWSGDRRLKVVCGGEALMPSLAAALTERAASVWNLYGPTETTIWSTMDRVEPGAAITIGRPIANTEVYVLDAHRQLVPVGVPGELYIGGAGLARGYLRREGLTAEQFVPHPFTDEPGGRLYRTGDLVRWRLDGRIDYLGRADHQVKLRGFRIELGEIETALAEHPDVARAAVVVREDAPGDKRLVAYVVSREGMPLSVATARTFLEKRLPSYMVPAAFVPLDALPLTPNGKVDRRSLPVPQRDSSTDSEIVRPRTPLEERVAGIWCEVLGLTEVGIDDDFFDLGGHSLLATQVVSRLRSELHVEVPLRTLFEASTVATLAEHLRIGD